MNMMDQRLDQEYTHELNEYPYPGKVYVHYGERLCEDCLVGIGVLPDHSDQHHIRVITDFNWCYQRPF